MARSQVHPEPRTTSWLTSEAKLKDKKPRRRAKHGAVVRGDEDMELEKRETHERGAK
jgi:hypothetical protein